MVSTTTHHLGGNTIDIVSDYRYLIASNKVSLHEFWDAFSSDSDCLLLYFNLKYENCDCRICHRPVVSSYSRVKDKRAFRCRSCHLVIFPLSDTIFRGSSIPLHSAFGTLFKFCFSPMSATEANLYLGTTYKTAHSFMMLTRSVLFNRQKNKMSGTVEVDEAFIGTGNKCYNWSGISTYKKPIIGLVERETKHARIFLLPNRNATTLNKIIRSNVESGSAVYTDSWKGYNDLSKWYTHEFVNHSNREYVRGVVHTQTIENIWSILKRNLRKHHIKITDKFVNLYMDEACWRYNCKSKKPMELFNEILLCTMFSPYR